MIIELNGSNYKIFKANGIELPEGVILSIEKRGMTVTNYRYIEETKQIQVLCSKCKEWYPVFKIENGKWQDINVGYQVSIDRKTKTDYFGSKCKECYQNELKNKNMEEKSMSDTTDLKEKNVSKKDGKQISTYLSAENYKFLKFKVAETDATINAIINKALEEYAEKNPINF